MTKAMFTIVMLTIELVDLKYLDKLVWSQNELLFFLNLIKKQLKHYANLNTDLRTKAKSKFENKSGKLMNDFAF